MSANRTMLNSGFRRLGSWSFLSLIWLATAVLDGAEPRAVAPPAKSMEVRGKLVCLAEEMHASFAADLPTQHAHILGFKTTEGIYYTLLRTKLSEALFADPQLKERLLMLTGRVYPGTQILDVTVMKSIRQGVVYDLYYWCDICAIKSVIPGECMCCQEHVVLKEVPLAPGANAHAGD